MGTGRKCWYLVVFAVAALAVGCDDDGDEAIDLTGWWLMEMRPAGMGAYEPMDIVCIQQVGSTVYAGDGPTMTLDGDKLTATIDHGGGDYTVADLTVTQNSFSGTMTDYLGGVLDGVYDIRGTRRAAPTGTLTASSPYDVNSTTAYGRAEYVTGTLEDIRFHHRDATSKFEMHLEGFSSMGPGTYDVASQIGVEVESDSDWDWATSGTVTIDSYSVDTAIAGSYSLDLDAGGTLTGTFDVSIEIVQSSP